jgi:hypothetical protein
MIATVGLDDNILLRMNCGFWRWSRRSDGITELPTIAVNDAMNDLVDILIGQQVVARLRGTSRWLEQQFYKAADRAVQSLNPTVAGTTN